MLERRIIRGLLGVLCTIALLWIGWVSAAVSKAGPVEARQIEMKLAADQFREITTQRADSLDERCRTLEQSGARVEESLRSIEARLEDIKALLRQRD